MRPFMSVFCRLFILSFKNSCFKCFKSATDLIGCLRVPSADPHNLGIRCLVNGDTVQSSNTGQMIFKIAALIARVSKHVTLTPGDVFLTGTPPGVGFFRNPPIFLKKGDVVECQIDQLGSIINKVV